MMVSSGVSWKRSTLAIPSRLAHTTSRTRRRCGCCDGATSSSSSSPESGEAQPQVTTTMKSLTRATSLLSLSFSKSYTSPCSL
ncbi:MAG: hypothetical protein ACK56F_18285, partial [bacterium]